MSEADRANGKKDNTDFDGVFEHISSFGRRQRILFFGLNTILVFAVTNQFSLLVFAFGTPGFHCVTPNLTCEEKKCCEGCKVYEFDGPYHSTVSEWNLICDRAFLGATIQSCFFVGMLVGSFVTGIFSDAWGRKKCIFVSNAVMLLSGVASSFVHNIPLFAVLRFVSGFGLTGVMLSLYIYGLELVGPSIRTAAGNMTYFFYNGYQMLLVLIAYYVRSWRTLVLITTTPAILIFPFWKFMPESPRWLIARDCLDEAQTILESFGGKNEKTTVDSQALRSVIKKVREDQLARERKSKKYSLLDLLRSPKLRKWTSIICYQWFAVALVSFGIFIFISQLVGNLYVNYIVMEVLTTARIPVTWFLYLKNTGQGTGSTSARIGGILAPYIALLGQLPGLSIAVPVIIFAAVALLAGISMYWVPETLFAPMHQTPEEVEAAQEDFGIPCCGRRRTTENVEEKDAIEMTKTEA
ncbi:organic cation transporter protein-like isoform X2 [Acropora palmata]|uniref:organic cation transporter protein-like isoform X2 n=1 Tax=Acropora palmata TaxID=6131 RepID=UPI003DA04778